VVVVGAVIRLTAQQEAFVNVAAVFCPDKNQQDQQQGLKQHQKVEYFHLELIETDEVQHAVQGLEQGDAEIGQRETVVQDGQRVELGERGQAVQAADRCGIVRRVDVQLLKLHYSTGDAMLSLHAIGSAANGK